MKRFLQKISKEQQEKLRKSMDIVSPMVILLKNSLNMIQESRMVNQKNHLSLGVIMVHIPSPTRNIRLTQVMRDSLGLKCFSIQNSLMEYGDHQLMKSSTKLFKVPQQIIEENYIAYYFNFKSRMLSFQEVLPYLKASQIDYNVSYKPGSIKDC